MLEHICVHICIRINIYTRTYICICKCIYRECKVDKGPLEEDVDK